jgi:hypothetical protein
MNLDDPIEIDFQFQEDTDNSNSKDYLQTSNFGGGLELLMNNKVKENKNQKSHLEDLEELENDLNNLAEIGSINDNKSTSDLFHFTKVEEDKNRTWDGYGKIDNVTPIPPPSKPAPVKDDSLREKFKLLKKLNDLSKKGIELSKNYTMDSSTAEMQGEYDSIMDDMSKKQSVQFQRNMFCAVIQGIEFLNKKFDPFDIQLDGLTEKVDEDMDSYDEIFGELHEKYKSKATMAPELKLLFQLGGSAMMIHFTNTLLKNSAPGVDEIFRQNPDLMRNFQDAALKTMSQTNPGFAGFMSGMTEQQTPTPPPPQMGRNPNFQEPIQQSFQNGFPNYKDMKNTNYIDTRPNFQDNFPPPSSQQKRSEMKGPSDISDLLSGIKTKNIHIKKSDMDNQSTISMNELNAMDGNLPKKSRRKKNTSLNNTVSHDI